MALLTETATPPFRYLPPLLPPEKSSNKEEGNDGPDLAKEIQPCTPRLHMGRRLNSKSYATFYIRPGASPSSALVGIAGGEESGSGWQPRKGAVDSQGGLGGETEKLLKQLICSITAYHTLARRLLIKN
jgi:hypothetical protein